MSADIIAGLRTEIQAMKGEIQAMLNRHLLAIMGAMVQDGQQSVELLIADTASLDSPTEYVSARVSIPYQPAPPFLAVQADALLRIRDEVDRLILETRHTAARHP